MDLQITVMFKYILYPTHTLSNRLRFTIPVQIEIKNTNVSLSLGRHVSSSESVQPTMTSTNTTGALLSHDAAEGSF